MLAAILEILKTKSTTLSDDLLKQKRGDLKKNWIPFIKLHETLYEYSP
jgi:hypothetical protein